MSVLRSPYVVLMLCVAAAGCDGAPNALVNPDQPRDLGAPWVNKTETEMSFSTESTDAAMNHIFTVHKDEFGGLLDSIASQFQTPIAVKPKKILTGTSRSK